MKSTMRNLSVFFIMILFAGCTQKSIPYFQNTNHPNLITKNILASPENVSDDTVEQVNNQNQNVASISTSGVFIKKDLPEESVVVKVQEKTAITPTSQKKERAKWRQGAINRQSHFEDKPKKEKAFDAWASTFGFITLGIILLGIVIAFFTPLAIMLIAPSIITANIALLLGAFSVKKTEKKQKAKFGITVGVIMDILLLIFLIWVATF